MGVFGLGRRFKVLRVESGGVHHYCLRRIVRLSGRGVSIPTEILACLVVAGVGGSCLRVVFTLFVEACPVYTSSCS